jgi:hypothetical protein
VKHFNTIGVITVCVLLGAFTGWYFLWPKTNAEIELITPDSYVIGELVVLDASNSPGVLQWTILPETPNFKIVGKTAYFSSSNATQYTVFISGTIGGTLATKVVFLNPWTNEDEKEKENQNDDFLKISKMIDGGIVTTLDDALSATEQLGLVAPDVKTLKEFKQWLDR